MERRGRENFYAHTLLTSVGKKLNKGWTFQEVAFTDPILAKTKGNFFFAWHSNSMHTEDEKQRN